MRRTALACLLALVARPLVAQGYVFVPRVQPEVRAEASVARHASALALIGANVPVGLYVRVGAAVGAGVADSDDGTVVATRADVALRFLLDPFAEHAWGPYAGGGLTVRRHGGEPARAGLLLILGVEGRRARRWTPAVEAALGEGVRLAVVLRTRRANGR
ncbi:MAG: hypothetical protein HY944_05945 [Gemmatimonadetes bacterium]|nr:hypothetical protein [Gemmatimonadota bacterium]